MGHQHVKSIHEPEESTLVTAIPLDLPGKWYVAHCRSRNEKILAKELSILGVFNYLPLNRRQTRSPATGRISHSLVPVFPGYVFFNGNEDQRYLALRTNRIAAVLDVPNQEQLVAELTQIQTLVAKDESFAVVPHIHVGDWGRIIAGPLRGLEGVVTQCSGGFRLTMNVTILGQSVHVEVDRDKIEPIEAPAYACSKAYPQS